MWTKHWATQANCRGADNMWQCFGCKLVYLLVQTNQWRRLISGLLASLHRAARSASSLITAPFVPLLLVQLWTWRGGGQLHNRGVCVCVSACSHQALMLCCMWKCAFLNVNSAVCSGVLVLMLSIKGVLRQSAPSSSVLWWIWALCKSFKQREAEWCAALVAHKHCSASSGLHDVHKAGTKHAGWLLVDYNPNSKKCRIQWFANLITHFFIYNRTKKIYQMFNLRKCTTLRQK